MKRLLPLLFGLLLLPGPAAGDVLVVGGRPVRCTWFEDGDEVVVNPYNSTNRAMTWGVERVSKSRVRLDRVRPTETPEEEYCRRAFEIRAGTAEGHAALARWCEEKKLDGLAAREWERVLEADPANEEAKKELGSKGLKEVLRRNGGANLALGELMRAYLEADNAATRRVLFERMKREHDLSLPVSYLERAHRSGRLPRGRTDDVPLTLRAREIKNKRGVLYTMFVPSSYDPLRPTPLLVGLHGGGGGGKDGTEVTGSGPSAMNFYTGVAEERGWLVACPTALRAGWPDKANEPFLEAMLDELQLLYNVDLNRVYLTGHSMGGYGAWHWGVEWAERWAAFAPMAGGGDPASGRLKDTQTFVFVFHGADDNVVGPGPDRAAAENLRKNGNDFVYTELNGVGHGCPQEVLREMAALFEEKRLAVGRGRAFRRSDEIRSSWLERLPPKLRKEEIAYLGDPEPPEAGAAEEKPDERRKRLLAEIDLGGGRAEAAAAAFGEWGDEDSVKPLATRLLSAGRVGDDVRAACATALGGIGSADAQPHLQKALSDGSDAVYTAAIRALDALGDRAAGPALLRALDLQAKRFDEKRVGDSMSHNDQEIRCPILGLTARVASRLAPPAEAAARIHRAVVVPALLRGPKVQGLARAGIFPEQVEEALAAEVAEALGNCGGDEAAASLAASILNGLRRKFEGRGRVPAACETALAGLGLDPEVAAGIAPPPEFGP